MTVLLAGIAIVAVLGLVGYFIYLMGGKKKAIVLYRKAIQSFPAF